MRVRGRADICSTNAWRAQYILKIRLYIQHTLYMSEILKPCEPSVCASLEVAVGWEVGPIDGTTNAATVAENKPHYNFRVDDDAAWW